VEKIDRSNLKRACSACRIKAGSNEDDRDMAARGRQVALQLKSTHAWHMRVNNQARGVVQAFGPKKLLRRREDLDGKAG